MVIAPSIDSHAQSSPTSSSYAARPRAQSRRNTPAATHSWKRRCAELLEQMPVAFSAFHWQPVRNTKKIASIARRSGTRGLWQPSGCGLPGGKSGSICAHSASGIRQSSAVVIILPPVSRVC